MGLRQSNQIPKLPTLVSKTFPPGHKFPYMDSVFLDEAIWFWAVLRWKRRHIDWFFDESSFAVAQQKMKNVLDALGTESKVREYIQWFMAQDDSYTVSANWEFNYFSSAHMLNRYLGNLQSDEDMDWYRQYQQKLDELNAPLAKEINSKLKEIKKSKAAKVAEAKAEEAAKLGTDSAGVKLPFEK